MQVFENENDEGDAPYLAWTRANPDGFVITTNRGRSPEYMRLHRATCSMVTQPRSNFREDPFTSRAYIKACTTSPSELLEFCRQNDRLDPPDPCTRCKPIPDYRGDDPISVIARSAIPEQRAKPKQVTVETQRYERSVAVALLAKKLSRGRCSLCEEEAPFEGADGPFLECHHVQHLARGGPDTIANVVALCPNCHRRMHVLDLLSDVEKLTKIATARALAVETLPSKPSARPPSATP